MTIFQTIKFILIIGIAVLYFHKNIFVRLHAVNRPLCGKTVYMGGGRRWRNVNFAKIRKRPIRPCCVIIILFYYIGRWRRCRDDGIIYIHVTLL